MEKDELDEVQCGWTGEGDRKIGENEVQDFKELWLWAESD